MLKYVCIPCPLFMLALLSNTADVERDRNRPAKRRQERTITVVRTARQPPSADELTQRAIFVAWEMQYLGGYQVPPWRRQAGSAEKALAIVSRARTVGGFEDTAEVGDVAVALIKDDACDGLAPRPRVDQQLAATLQPGFLDKCQG